VNVRVNFYLNFCPVERKDRRRLLGTFFYLKKREKSRRQMTCVEVLVLPTVGLCPPPLGHAIVGCKRRGGKHLPTPDDDDLLSECLCVRCECCGGARLSLCSSAQLFQGAFLTEYVVLGHCTEIDRVLKGVPAFYSKRKI